MNLVDACLVLSFSRELEEVVIDFLLEHEDLVFGFSSQNVDAHGSGIGYASIAEQVSGRSRRVEFQLLVAVDGIDAILAALKGHLPHAEFSYWALPVLALGKVG